MKVIIDIPSKEFGEDIKDNFQDFFERVKVEIAHRINADDTLLCGNYELETTDMFLASFKRMQVLPDNATNGDMIKAMFPNCEVSIHEYMGIKCGVDVKIYFSENESFTAWFPSCLWNAPYKKER